jgi:hypothetical protein
MNCWHDEIDRCITEADVVQSARDYLALWAPVELQPLTLGWRDLKVESVGDIVRLKTWLTETSQLRELASYVWHAAARIEEIRRARLRLVTFALPAPAPPRFRASLQ